MKTLDELLYYCEEPEPVGAILLTGEWGCGKTYLIDNILKEALKDKAHVIRISLFGIATIEGIHMAVKQASVTAEITASSLEYLQLERPSTSFQPDHSLPLIACCRAYSLMSLAQETSSSARDRINSISESSSSGGSLKSCFASIRFASALALHSCFRSWVKDGALPTLDGFLDLPMEKRKEIYKFLMNASVYETIEYEGKTYILTHAGIDNFKEDADLDEYVVYDFLVGRPDYSRRYYRDERIYVVSGHTPTPYIRPDGKPEVFIGNGHIAIDCGAVFRGQLAAYCIETGEAAYVTREKQPCIFI